MKSTAIVCAVLAGTFGLSGIASAQGRHEDPSARLERQSQWNDSGSARGVDPAVRNAWAQAYGPQAREQARIDQRNGPAYQQPQQRYAQHENAYSQPRYAYNNSQARFYRGGYLPRTYWQPTYYVSNWQAYPSLYAPPAGYRWMNVDGNFLLVALATGLIANALVY